MAASRTKRVEVGGHAFRVRRFDAFTGLELLGDLQAKLVAPAMAILDGKAAGSDGAFAAQAANGLERVLRGLPGREMRALADKILDPESVSIELPGTETAIKLTPVAAEQHGLTAGDLVELCVEVVKHNFEDFWQRATARFGPALSQVLKPPANSAPT